jgi:hypothetical protein
VAAEVPDLKVAQVFNLRYAFGLPSTFEAREPPGKLPKITRREKNLRRRSEFRNPNEFPKPNLAYPEPNAGLDRG